MEVSEGVDLVAEDMLRILKDDSLSHKIAATEDAFLYQLVRYRAEEFNGEVLNQIFNSFEDSNYKVLALHDILMLYPDVNITELDTQFRLVQAGEASLTPMGKKYWQWVQAMHKQGKEGYAAIQKGLDQLDTLSLWHQYKKQLYTAKIAEMGQDSIKASHSYQYLINNPFYEEGFLNAVNYLYPDAGSMEHYELLLDAVQTNPDSPLLIKAYIRTSLANGLESYAEESLESLKTLVSDREYKAYGQTYQQLLKTYRPDF